MSTTIIYKDHLGDLISEQEALATNEYERFTIISGQLKMIKEVRKGMERIFTSIDYFLGPSENKNDIVKQYSDASNYWGCIVYYNHIGNADYDLWEYESYDREKQLKYIGKRVFDKLFRTICWSERDPTTGKLLEGSTKNFYTGHHNKKGSLDYLLRFEYDENGNVMSICDMQERFGYIEEISLQKYLEDTEFSQKDFPWDQHSYYHSLEPYLPKGPL